MTRLPQRNAHRWVAKALPPPLPNRNIEGGFQEGDFLLLRTRAQALCLRSDKGSVTSRPLAQTNTSRVSRLTLSHSSFNREQQERARQIRVRDEARKDLMRAIEAWGEVKRLHAFFADAETEARRLGSDERDRALARIARACVLIGEQDALGALLSWKSPDER